MLLLSLENFQAKNRHRKDGGQRGNSGGRDLHDDGPRRRAPVAAGRRRQPRGRHEGTSGRDGGPTAH